MIVPLSLFTHLKKLKLRLSLITNTGVSTLLFTPDLHLSPHLSLMIRCGLPVRAAGVFQASGQNHMPASLKSVDACNL